jgi:hypothetical protein
VDFFVWLENTDFAAWIRESPSLLGYTLYLALHTIGLVFLLGPTLVIGLRILGVIPRLPLAPMATFFPLMWFGLCVNALSGAVLFATGPVSFVRNPVFLIKLAAIAAALVCLRRFVRQVFRDDSAGVDTRPVPRNGQILIGASLGFWTVAVVAGRLTAYSAGTVLVSVAAVLTLIAAIALAAYLARLLGWIGRHGTAFDTHPSVAAKGE